MALSARRHTLETVHHGASNRVVIGMFRELSQTRITFVCGHCEHEWAADYEIRHVEDGHGHAADYYMRNGLPAVSPLAVGGVSCPRCGALHLVQHEVTVHLTPASAGGVPASTDATARPKGP